MKIEKLTESEKSKLKDLKIPYRNNLTLCLTIIGLISLLIIAVYFIGIYEDSLLFVKIKIQWSFPLVFTLFAIIWFKIKVKNIDFDLKTGTKKIVDFKIQSKGSEKYGTYSTGDYRASGSTDRLYIIFGDYKYHCLKDEFETFKEGDNIAATIADKSDLILAIKNASAQHGIIAKSATSSDR